MVALNYTPTLAPAPGPSPEALALQQAYAKQLLAGSDQPIHSWSQGLAGVVDALVGGTMARKAGEKQAAGEASAADQFAAMLMGQAPQPGPSPTSPAGGAMAASGAAPAASPPAAAGAPLVSQEQIQSLLRNPFASKEQKDMALELWKAQMPTPPVPEEYGYENVAGHLIRTGKHGGSTFEVYTAPEKPGDEWAPVSQPDAQGRVILRNWRNGDMKVAVDTDIKSPDRFSQDLELSVAGRPSVVVDNRGRELPDPEKGYAWKFGADGKVETNANGAPIQVPIGGGSVEKTEATAATEAADVQAGKTKNAETQAGYTDITTNTIDRILQKVEEHPDQTTGPFGALEASLGIGPGNDVSALLTPLESVAALDKLQEMREAARAVGAVGSGLGAVTAPELDLLKNRFTSLRQSQSTEQFKQNLRIFKEVYKAIVTRGIKAGDPILNEVSKPQPTPATPSRADIEAEMRRRGLMK